MNKYLYFCIFYTLVIGPPTLMYLYWEPKFGLLYCYGWIDNELWSHTLKRNKS